MACLKERVKKASNLHWLTCIVGTDPYADETNYCADVLQIEEQVQILQSDHQCLVTAFPLMDISVKAPSLPEAIVAYLSQRMKKTNPKIG